MKWLKTVALSAAVVSAAGLGVVLAPVVHGQSRAPRATTPRAAEVFTFAGGGRIGVAISDVDAEDVKGKGAAGVVIDDVDEDSPAAKAGLKKGDLVVEFDGERVRSVRQFTRLVGETPAGRTVPATVMRDGQRVTVSITPRQGGSLRFLDSDNWHSGAFETLRRFGATTPPVPPRPATPPRPPAVLRQSPPLPPTLEHFFWRSGNRLGIATDDLSPQLAEYFGTKDGVLVSSVEENSAAAKAGVKAGDVITSVNGSSVESASELRRRLSNLDAGEEFTLGVVRDKRTMTLKGKLETVGERRRTTRTIL